MTTATQTTHIIGGPLDGTPFDIPAGCIEFYADPGPEGIRRLHYRYCPFASARFGKDCFIYASIAFDFFAP